MHSLTCMHAHTHTCNSIHAHTHVRNDQRHLRACTLLPARTQYARAQSRKYVYVRPHGHMRTFALGPRRSSIDRSTRAVTRCAHATAACADASAYVRQRQRLWICACEVYFPLVRTVVCTYTSAIAQRAGEYSNTNTHYARLRASMHGRIHALA